MHLYTRTLEAVNHHHQLLIEDVMSKKDKVNYWLLYAAKQKIPMNMNLKGSRLFSEVINTKSYNQLIDKKLLNYSYVLEETLTAIITNILVEITEKFIKETKLQKKAYPRLKDQIDSYATSYLSSVDALQQSPSITNYRELHEFTCHAIKTIEEMNRVYSHVGALLCLDALK